MIIFFKRNSDSGAAQPVAVLDYTRSDDQYSYAQIQKFAIQAAAKIKILIDFTTLSVFSLNYSVAYKHSGVNLGDALKTSIGISISNAPSELSSLINMKQIVGQESALSLGAATKKVIDAQNEFPYGVLIFELPGPGGTTNTIIKTFMVYGTNYNFDARRVNSTLRLKGASFDSMVMRLSLNFNIEGTLPLMLQLQTALASTGYAVSWDTELTASFAVVERYYPPAPLNKMLARVCQDNGIFFDLDEDQKTIYFKSLNSKAFPPGYFPTKLSFRGTVPGSNLISTFSVQDYAIASFKTEVMDLNLFDVVEIFDDSGASGLFDNFRDTGIPFGLKPLYSYQFYILEYILAISAQETTMEIKATNNWLLSNFKLDTLFENAVYAGIR